MMRELTMALLGATTLLVATGCPPSAVGGCDKDTDCKGERICVQRACIYPPGAPNAAPAPMPGPPSVGPGQGPPPPVVVPPSTPQPPAQPPIAPPPRPQPQPVVPPPSSGQVNPAPKTGPCGCARDDLMCNMRCSSKDNPARPPFPKSPLPPPSRGVGF